MNSLTIIDEGGERSDLARRSELKFVITDGDIAAIRSILGTNCRRIVHNHSVSTVRSVYFDDQSLSACYANLDGLGRRSKLRLRWYDSLVPTKTMFLELKWRQNRVTGKHRFAIQSATGSLASLSFRTLFQELEQLVPPEIAPFLILNCEPVVLVEYQREHFSSADGRTRITIDYGLTFYDQMGRSCITTSYPMAMNDVMILEGKGAVGTEHRLQELFHPMHLRAARFSKYVHGCHMLGMIQLAKM